MKYFYDPKLGVRAFEADGSQDSLITEEMRPMTEAEAMAYIAPTAEQIQAQVNAEAQAYLANTDWYVVRAQETGEPIPTGVSEARAAARQRIVALLD